MIAFFLKLEHHDSVGIIKEDYVALLHSQYWRL